MKTANYDFILPFFIASDNLRPAMNFVHLHENGFVYATNAHILIKVPVSNCVLKYHSVDRFPNAEAMFHKFHFENTAIIKTDQLIETLSAYKWSRQKQVDKCTKCDGEGAILCDHCNHDHECETCKGDGEIVKGFADCQLLITDDNYAVVKIMNKLFKADFIHILAICAKMIGVDEIQFSYNDENYDPHVFTVGDAQILIMPRQSGGADDFMKEIKVINRN